MGTDLQESTNGGIGLMELSPNLLGNIIGFME